MKLQYHQKWRLAISCLAPFAIASRLTPSCWERYHSLIYLLFALCLTLLASQKQWSHLDSLSSFSISCDMFRLVHHFLLDCVSPHESASLNPFSYRAHEAIERQQAENIARSLPEPTCTILRSCYWGEKTYQQVAEDELGISPDTVKKHISKSMRTLRSDTEKEDKQWKRSFQQMTTSIRTTEESP